MIEKPLVTIVTPSFGQAAYIEETIISVLNQDYTNIEYIVIDGGSKDGSIDIIKKYEKQLAFWVSEPDHGQADAINKGWLHAKGEYIGWLNSDDILNRGSISKTVGYFQEHPDVEYIYGDVTCIDEAGNFMATFRYPDFDIQKILKEAGNISQPGSLFKRSVLEKVGLLDTSLHFMMDADLWIRAGLVCKFGHIPEPLASFRYHITSKTSARSDLAAQDILTIYNKLFANVDLPLSIRNIENEARSSAHLYSAYKWLSINKVRTAYDEMILAVKYFPRIILRKKFIKFFLSLAVIIFFGYNFFQRLRNMNNSLHNPSSF